MTMIRCTFWGRLDDGKGADVLVDILPGFLSQARLHDWEFHVFGSGKYEARLEQLATQYPQIICHGRSSREEIKSIAQQGHYCLCPSTFLETFGMSALEGCKLGLPIIGPSKGGLQQFIVPDLEKLWKGTITNTQGLLSQLEYIDTHHNESYTARQQETFDIASHFGLAIRADKISTLL